eukprot:2406554-Rhodomonas_salina.1
MASTTSHTPANVCDTEPSSRKATVTFDTTFPFLVLSADGHMSALTGLGSSRMAGRSIRMFQNLGEDPVDILWAAQAASSGRTVSIHATMDAKGDKVQFLAEFCLDESSPSGPVLKMVATETAELFSSSQPWSATRSSEAIDASNMDRNSPDIELLLTEAPPVMEEETAFCPSIKSVSSSASSRSKGSVEEVDKLLSTDNDGSNILCGMETFEEFEAPMPPFVSDVFSLNTC